MAHPRVRGLEKSYSIGRRRVVSWQLRRARCPLIASWVQFLAYLDVVADQHRDGN